MAVAAGTASQAQLQQVADALKGTKADDIEGTMAKALKFFDHDGGDNVTVSELSHVRAWLNSSRQRPDS